MPRQWHILKDGVPVFNRAPFLGLSDRFLVCQIVFGLSDRFWVCQIVFGFVGSFLGLSDQLFLPSHPPA